MSDATPPKKRRLRPDEVEAIFGIPKSTYAKMRWRGDCWPYDKVGKSVLADPDVIEAWLIARRRCSTSDVGRA